MGLHVEMMCESNEIYFGKTILSMKEVFLLSFPSAGEVEIVDERFLCGRGET